MVLLLLFLQGQSQIKPLAGSSNKYSISCNNLFFEVNADDGARISSFKLNGDELMYVAFSLTDMAGSTFWPSPQSVWNWPPMANLDNKPYTATVSENRMMFTGSTDSKYQLRFYKTMVASMADTSIVIEYTIKNEKSTAQTWAPWEVTRVIAGGLTLFGKGDGSLTGDMASRMEEEGDYVWYDQDETAGGKGNKIFCDGKGWLAHVIDGEKLFVKQFEDIANGKAAPGEAEVEIYTTSDHVYTELEDQGAYASIAAKDSVTWKVKWFARVLPSSVDVSVGSASLTAYIENMLKRSGDISGTHNLSVAANVKVFPNPATEYLVVESNLKSYDNTLMYLYDLQGQMMVKQSLETNNQKVNIRSVANGNYVYLLKQNGKVLSRGKLAIQR